MASESCFSLTLRTGKGERKRRLQSLTKTPEALLVVGAIAALAVAMWSHANFDSDILRAIPRETKTSYEIRELR